MPLNAMQIANAKPKPKPYKLSDGDGLALQVNPNGSKWWRFRYFIQGKEKMLSFGTYPEVSLADARDRRWEARKLVENGTDPSAAKKEAKRLTVQQAVNTFRAVAEEWHAKHLHTWSAEHGPKLLRRLEKHVFPDLGSRPINEIKPFELLTTLQKIEQRDTTEILRRVAQTCVKVFRYGIVTGRCEINPAAHLQGAFKPHKAKHYPTLQAKELPTFMRKLEEVETSEQNRLALKLLMFTFVRTGEMRKAKWEDIHLDRALWVLPAANMKMRLEHHVPLSKKSIEILTRLKELAGNNPFGLLLPSQNRQENPMMCENTINNLIAKMGYKGQLVGHGFRALASTTLNEVGKFKPDVIERQLAHREANQVRAAYNRAEYWEERVEMMQWWADYLGTAAKQGKVIKGRLGRTG